MGFWLNVLFAAACDVFDREVSNCEMSCITLSAARGNLRDRLRPCVDIHASKNQYRDCGDQAAKAESFEHTGACPCFADNDPSSERPDRGPQARHSNCPANS